MAVALTSSLMPAETDHQPELETEPMLYHIVRAAIITEYVLRPIAVAAVTTAAGVYVADKLGVLDNLKNDAKADEPGVCEAG